MHATELLFDGTWIALHPLCMTYYPGTRIPHDVVDALISLFHRLENAIMHTGFVFAGPRGRAMADWDAFRLKAATELRLNDELARAVRSLRRMPPRCLFLRSGDLRWEDSAFRDNNPVAQAIESAQRVRNNLFHGNKFQPERRRGRNERLARWAIQVLQACTELDGIRDRFNQTFH